MYEWSLVAQFDAEYRCAQALMNHSWDFDNGHVYFTVFLSHLHTSPSATMAPVSKPKVKYCGSWNYGKPCSKAPCCFAHICKHCGGASNFDMLEFLSSQGFPSSSCGCCHHLYTLSPAPPALFWTLHLALLVGVCFQ